MNELKTVENYHGSDEGRVVRRNGKLRYGEADAAGSSYDCEGE